MVQNLNLSSAGEKHVQALAPSIARSLLALMSACCDQIDSHAAWEVLLSLLESTTSHPDAVLPVAAALDTICRDGRGMCAANYMQVVTAIRALVVSASGLWMAAEQAREAGREAVLPFDENQIRASVDLLEMVATWLQTWRQRQAQVRLCVCDGAACVAVMVNIVTCFVLCDPPELYPTNMLFVVSKRMRVTCILGRRLPH